MHIQVFHQDHEQAIVYMFQHLLQCVHEDLGIYRKVSQNHICDFFVPSSQFSLQLLLCLLLFFLGFLRHYTLGELGIFLIKNTEKCMPKYPLNDSFFELALVYVLEGRRCLYHDQKKDCIHQVLYEPYRFFYRREDKGEVLCMSRKLQAINQLQADQVFRYVIFFVLKVYDACFVSHQNLCIMAPCLYKKMLA